MYSVIKQVLVVDDQSNWRKALRILLEKEGLQVSEAKNSQEAKDMIDPSNSKFDLAVLDIRLIDEETLNMEGLDLLHFIKDSSPTTKTIVLTGYPKAIRDKPESDEFILKVPEKATFDIKGFQEKVRRLLGD